MTMMFVLLIVYLLPSGAQASDCAIGLIDEVAAIVDGYRNVQKGVKETTHFQLKSRGPSFNNAIGGPLQQDICDLEKLASNIFQGCKTCPGCNDTVGDCVFLERDLVFVLDSSGTINGAERIQIQTFVTDLINRLDKGGDVVRVAVLYFATTVVTVFDLDDFIGNLSGASQTISDFRPQDQGIGIGTSIDKALDAVRENILHGGPGDRTNVRDTLIILGDGESSAPFDTNVANDKLIMAIPDLEVITIGVGINNETELMVLARPPGNFFSVDNTATLPTIENGVLEELCQPCDPPCENGATCVASKNQCMCAPGFIGSRCQSKSVCT